MEQIILDNITRMNLALESADMGALDIDIEKDTSIRTLDHDKIFGYNSLLPEWGLKIFLNIFYQRILSMYRKDLKHPLKQTNYISSAESSGQIKKSGGLRHMEMSITTKKACPSEY